MRRAAVRAFAALLGADALLHLAGCAQTSHVDGGLQAGALAIQNKAVAVMRLGSPNPNCQHVAVMLGVRDGAGFKRHTPVRVADVRGLAKSPVGEVELDPGEYHVVAIQCVINNAPTVVGDKTVNGTYLKSFAHFTVTAGEIVNVGFLHLDAARVQSSGFGKALRPELTVSEWPLDDIERYKAARPELAAQMKTRLMIVGDGPKTAGEQADQCVRWRQAQTDGLAQGVPKECTSP